MIHLVIKTQWENTKLDNKILETQSIKNKDIVFIGSGNNSMTKCVEYAEKESMASDDKTLYHIYSIITSRCNYMTFNSGLSNHTHLEKMIIYKGDVMIRKIDTDTTDLLSFDSNLSPKNNSFNNEIQTFMIIHKITA